MHLLFTRGARFVLALAATLGTTFGGFAQAQTATLKLSPVMYFYQSSPLLNSALEESGRNALGNIISDNSGRFFGVTGAGGAARGGLLYRLEADRSSVATIYQYGRLGVWEGANPNASLYLASDGNLYGVTRYNSIDTLLGGITGNGTIFRLSVDGAYTKLAEFDAVRIENRDYTQDNYAVNDFGYQAEASLIGGIESGVLYLYGTTFRGGRDGTGVVFKLRADGVGGIQVIHHFGEATLKDLRNANGDLVIENGITQRTFDLNNDNQLKNPDGANPTQRLLFGSDGKLYGVTRGGGVNGTGVVFRLSVNGQNFESVPFDVTPATIPQVVQPVPVPTPPLPEDPRYQKPKTNFTGAYPEGGLVEANGIIYGTATSHGGEVDATTGGGYGGGYLNNPYGYGTVFSVNPAAATLAIQPILKFTGAGTTAAPGLNPGETPRGNLIVADDALVGTTSGNGSTTEGVSGGSVYKLSLVGATLTQLCIFAKTDVDASSKGIYPTLGVIQSPVDNAFYGISSGGTSGEGVIFKCGATDHTGPVLGVPPPYDDGSSGAISPGLLAALGLLLVMQARRTRRVRKN